MSELKVEVLIIGGGFSGLLTLQALLSKGYDAMILTEGKIGEGQSLHNHGK